MWSTSLLMSNLSRHSVLPLIAHPLLMDVESSSSLQIWSRTTDSLPNRDVSPGTIKEVILRLDFVLPRKLRLASFLLVSVSELTPLPRWCFFFLWLQRDAPRSSSLFGHLPERLYPPPTSHLGFKHWWEPVQFTLPSAALCWHQLVFSVRPSCPGTPGHKKKFGAQLSWENPLFPRGSAPTDLWHSTSTSLALSVRNAGLLTLPSPVYWVRICYFRFLVIHMLLKVVLSSGSTKG